MMRMQRSVFNAWLTLRALGIAALATLSPLSTAAAQGQPTPQAVDAARNALIDQIHARHPGWRRLNEIMRTLPAAYEAMRAANPGQPTLAEAWQAAGAARMDDLRAHASTAGGEIEGSRGFQSFVSNGQTLQQSGGVTDLGQTTRAQREAIVGGVLQTPIVNMSAIVESDRASMLMLADLLDRVMTVHPFDPAIAQRYRADIESVRNLSDYHGAVSRAALTRAAIEIEEQVVTQTDRVERWGGFRGANPTTDLPLRSDSGAFVTYHTNGDITLTGLEPGTNELGSWVFSARTPGSSVNAAFVEQFIRLNFGADAEQALRSLQVERIRQQTEHARNQRNAQAINRALQELQTLIGTPGIDPSDPRWRRLREALAETGLPELVMPDETFDLFLRGGEGILVAVLEPIYAGVDLDRGARIERITPSVWELARSSVAQVPSFQGFTPSSIATVPSLWGPTPSTVMNTPNVWANTPSSVATTPNLWANTPSSVATTPDFWGANGRSSADDRTRDPNAMGPTPRPRPTPPPAQPQLCGR